MSVDEQRTNEIKRIYKRETREPKEPKKEVSKEQVGKELASKEVNMTKGSANKEPVNMVKGLIGKDITIYIRGGKELKCRLEAVAQYELVVTISQSPVIVMKHAVDYIIPVGEK